MKITISGKTDFGRFDAAMKRLLSVSYAELQRRLAKEEKAKKRKRGKKA